MAKIRPKPLKFIRQMGMRKRPVRIVINERQLPRGQKVLVVLPHSDDGIFMGASLHEMNKPIAGKPRNKMKILVYSPGYRGVDKPGTPEQKAEMRWGEALRWGEILGFRPGQFHNFNALRTYNSGRIHPEDQMSMDKYIAGQKPSMVFVPPRLDTEQKANINTYNSTMTAIKRFLQAEHRRGRAREIMVVEYPTDHVPVLPPVHKNLVVGFSNPEIAEIKHKAADAHESQGERQLDAGTRMVEAFSSTTAREDEHRDFGRSIAKTDLGSMRGPLRSEHFGLSVMRVEKRRGRPVIVQRRLNFRELQEYAKRMGMFNA